MRWAVLVAVVAAGCTSSGTIVCGQLTCPAGYVCSPDGTACATPAQVAACTGVDDATVCTDRPGVCRGGYCQDIVCGDERTDPGEACDDGNAIPFDGCSIDCLSTQTCGNSTIDAPIEDCDDGNTAANDGCNAMCENESPIWRELAATAFPPRHLHAMTYDSVRERIVMFGGAILDGGGKLANDTWEFDGKVWIKRTPVTSPPVRELHALAYDIARQRTVLFGGRNGTTMYSDVWEWDGTNWTQRFPTAANVADGTPVGRLGMTLVYDPVRQVVVMNAGMTQGTPDDPHNDTWEYNGSTWAKMAGVTHDAILIPMTYDSTVGGIVAYLPLVMQNRVYANGMWGTLPAGTGSGAVTPRGRNGAVFVTDPDNNRVMMIGGAEYSCGAGTNCGDAFELVEQGTTNSFYWKTIGVPYAPSNAAAAYHAASHQVVIMGGRLAGNQLPENATWIFRINQWRRLSEPGARVGCQMSYMPGVGTVVFGGRSKNQTNFELDDFWVLRDNRWSPMSTTSTVPPETGHGAMAFDRARGRLVLLANNSTTWEYDGTDWVDRTAAVGAPGLVSERVRMVFDEARNAIVLFGGFQTNGNVLDQTWTYDGTSWVQLTTTGAPSARGDFGMTYDAARSAVVLVGGVTPAGLSGETWELVGTMWTQNTSTGPSPRSGTTLTYDPNRRSSILFGGLTADGYASDTWEYRDGAWSEVQTVNPYGRRQHCATYDESTRKTVILGGTVLTDGLPDTWLFGYE